ncbi:MAG: hypothetical protein ACOCWQ_00845 [Nanoarchaeota archaeon]
MKLRSLKRGDASSESLYQIGALLVVVLAGIAIWNIVMLVMDPNIYVAEVLLYRTVLSADVMAAHTDHMSAVGHVQIPVVEEEFVKEVRNDGYTVDIELDKDRVSVGESGAQLEFYRHYLTDNTLHPVPFTLTKMLDKPFYLVQDKEELQIAADRMSMHVIDLHCTEDTLEKSRIILDPLVQNTDFSERNRELANAMRYHLERTHVNILSTRNLDAASSSAHSYSMLSDNDDLLISVAHDEGAEKTVVIYVNSEDAYSMGCRILNLIAREIPGAAGTLIRSRDIYDGSRKILRVLNTMKGHGIHMQVSPGLDPAILGRASVEGLQIQDREEGI